MSMIVYEGTVKHELPVKEGATILEVLQEAGIQSITAPCGGKGTCKKCNVFVRSEDFTGMCLSCTTPAKDGMVIELVPEARVSFADSSDGKIWDPDPGQSGCAVACDIGTTKIICQLINLETGELLSVVSGSNSQRIFGGDVLSRLKAAEEGHADELHGLIIRQISVYVGELCRKEGIPPEEIRLITAAGNTIMLHFFAGLDPAQISTAPFTPVSLFGEWTDGKTIGLDYDAKVYLCPAASGFIGSDVLCGILSTGMAESDEDMMMIDLGTNTEIVMGNKDQMIACAADGGAAFKASLLDCGMSASAGAISSVKYEDGELELEVLGAGTPKGICGSGFIDLLALFYREEIMDEMGHIAAPGEVDSELGCYIGIENDRPVFYLTADKKLFVSQEDISRFMMSKAAIAAGMHILAEEKNTELSDIKELLLAGGFGAFAHRSNSALLGMIPAECKGKTTKMGNTSLAGVISAALSESARKELSGIQKRIRVIDLPTHPSFSDAYMDGMIFE